MVLLLVQLPQFGLILFMKNNDLGATCVKYKDIVATTNVGGGIALAEIGVQISNKNIICIRSRASYSNFSIIYLLAATHAMPVKLTSNYTIDTNLLPNFTDSIRVFYIDSAYFD